MKNSLQFSNSVVKAGRKQLRFSLITVLFCLCAVLAYPQLKITSSGNVGIDTSNPVSRFSIGDAGSTESKMYLFNSNSSGIQRALYIRQALSSGSWSYGVHSSVVSGSSGSKATGVCGSSAKSTPSSSGRTFGILGRAGNATSGYNSAVYGQLKGSNNGAAIFGATPGKGETYVNGIYAGYFRGKVFIEDKVGIKTTSPSYDLDVNGTIRCVSLTQTSDLGIKRDVKNLEKGSLAKLEKLQGVSYKLKTPEELRISSQLTMVSDTGVVELPRNELAPELYNKEFTGFIAQDVAQVYPELISEDIDGHLSINYIGLIPVLVEAIKEQQAEIDALKQQLGK